MLGLFFGHPGEAFYLREVVRNTGLGVGQVQRELARLGKGGLLRRWNQGMHVYFQADPGCPIYGELRILVTKTSGAAGTLRSALLPLADRVRVAFVFGSVARGTETKASDVDLLIIGGVSLSEVVRAIRSAQSDLRREINPTVYGVKEARAKAAAGGSFLHRVLRQPRVFVLGDEHELARLLAERLDPRA